MLKIKQHISDIMQYVKNRIENEGILVEYDIFNESLLIIKSHFGCEYFACFFENYVELIYTGSIGTRQTIEYNDPEMFKLIEEYINRFKYVKTI